MKISCKTITHGRPHLLEEALFSFLNQDWDGDAELVIVNDCPYQTLHFEHPKVRIENFKNIFPTIGEKENYTVEICTGDIIVTWDDDDIAMPWHFKNIKKYWQKDTNLLMWGKGVYYNEPNITAITGIGNSGIVYSKKAWEAIGKSPIENAGWDATFVRKLKMLNPANVVIAYPPDNEVSWFYRWQTPFNYHQSGLGTDTDDRPNIVQRNSEYVKNLIDIGVLPKGDIYLEPKWRFDYKGMLEKYTGKKYEGN